MAIIGTVVLVCEKCGLADSNTEPLSLCDKLIANMAGWVEANGDLLCPGCAEGKGESHLD